MTTKPTPHGTRGHEGSPTCPFCALIWSECGCDADLDGHVSCGPTPPDAAPDETEGCPGWLSERLARDGAIVWQRAERGPDQRWHIARHDKVEAKATQAVCGARFFASGFVVGDRGGPDRGSLMGRDRPTCEDCATIAEETTP